MRSVLLQSLMLAVLFVPIMAARDRSPRRGLKKAFTWLMGIVVGYAFALRFLYPHLS
jgi:hypothetical protein